jgi:hypothetical protein
MARLVGVVGRAVQSPAVLFVVVARKRRDLNETVLRMAAPLVPVRPVLLAAQALLDAKPLVRIIGRLDGATRSPERQHSCDNDLAAFSSAFSLHQQIREGLQESGIRGQGSADSAGRKALRTSRSPQKSFSLDHPVTYRPDSAFCQ